MIRYVIRDLEGNDAFHSMIFERLEQAVDFIKDHGERQADYHIMEVHEDIKDILDVVGDC
jgi:hypothetical protein